MKRLLTAAVLLALSASPHVVSAQGEILPALSGDHALLTGGSRALGDDQAQVQFSLDGSFTTARYDAERERYRVNGPVRSFALAWDASFDMGGVAEIGARVRFSYLRDGDDETLGPDLLGAGIRVRALEDPAGPWLTVGLAFAQELLGDTAEMVELDVVLGGPLSGRLVLEAAASGQVRFHDQAESRHAALGVGPVWQATDWLGLSLDVQGRYGRRPRAEEDFWDATAGLRLSADLGAGHELAIGGWRTLWGQSIEEEAVGLLTWRIRWQPDGGLLRLDSDGDLVPSDLIETRDESSNEQGPGEGEQGPGTRDQGPEGEQGPGEGAEEPQSRGPADLRTCAPAHRRTDALAHLRTCATAHSHER